MGLMEKLNGRIKKVCIRFDKRSKKQALDMGRTYSNRGAWYFWLILVCTLSIAGCSFPKIKTALMTGAATTAAVGVTSVVPLIKVEATDEEAAELSAEPADYSVYPAGAGAEIAAATDEFALAA